MNQTLAVRIIALAIVACASPIAVWADLSYILLGLPARQRRCVDTTA